jgi:hypothetical protein
MLREELKIVTNHSSLYPGGLRPEKDWQGEEGRRTNPQGRYLTGPSAEMMNETPFGLAPDLNEDELAEAGFFTDIVRGVGRGVIGAVDEVTDISTTLAGGALKFTGLGEAFGGEDFLDWWELGEDERNPLHVGKETIEAPSSIVGGLVEGITQIGIGLVGVGKFAKVARLGKVGDAIGLESKLVKNLLHGATADAIFFDPQEERLSNMMLNGPQWMQDFAYNAIIDVTALAADEDDSDFVGRMKNAGEGLLLGGTLDLLARGLFFRKLWKSGDKEAALAYAATIEPPVRPTVDIGNGYHRISMGPEDAPLLKEVQPPPLEGLDVIHTPQSRHFEFDVDGVPYRVAAQVEGDILDIHMMGEYDPRTGSIDISDPGNVNKMGYRRAKAVVGELVSHFAHDPDWKAVEFTKLNPRDEAIRPVMMKTILRKRIEKNIFSDVGKAESEILSKTEIREGSAMDPSSIREEAKPLFEEVKQAYATNRNLDTIRRAETEFARKNRTSIQANEGNLTQTIIKMGRELKEVAGPNGVKSLRTLNKEILDMVDGKTSMEAMEANVAQLNDDIVRAIADGEVTPAHVVRGAGIMLKSLASDVGRYSVRIQQGGGDLAYLQMGQALDQMIMLEELLTGKPSLWYERAVRLSRQHAELGGERHFDRWNQELYDPDEVVMERTFSTPDGGKEVTPIRRQEADAVLPAAESLNPKVQSFLHGVAAGPRILNSMSKREIERFGKYVALAGDNPAAILISAKAARLEALDLGASQGKKLWDAMVRWRMNAILSGIKTSMVNITSTMVQGLIMPAELMVGGALSGSPKAFRMGREQLKHILNFHEWKDSWAAAAAAFRAKRGNLDPQFMTREVDPDRFTGWMKWANFPMDFLTAQDEFFKVINYRGRVSASSISDSIERGLNSKEISERLYADLQASHAMDGHGMYQDGLKYARTATFTDDLADAGTFGGMARAARQMIDSTPLGRLFVPFFRTPHNILRQIGQRTPVLQMASRSLREDLAAGGIRAANAHGKIATATAWVVGAFALVQAGVVTGGGPRHPVTRKRWEEAGNKPYTINMFGHTFYYNKLSSFFGPLAMVSELWSMSGNLDDESFTEGLTMIVSSMARYMSNVSWLSNFSEMTNSLAGGDIEGLNKFFEQTAASAIVPEAVAQFADMDDTMRQADTFLETLMERVPGLSQKLPPRLNIFREPVFKAPGDVQRVFNPFTSLGPSKDQEALMQMYRVGRQLQLPQSMKFNDRVDLENTNRWGTVDGMSPYEYMLENQAHPPGMPSLKEALIEEINSTHYQMLPIGSEDWPGGPRFKRIASIVGRYSRLGETQMLTAFPELNSVYVQEKALRRIGRARGVEGTDQLQEIFKDLERN